MEEKNKYQQFANDLYHGILLPCPECGKEQSKKEPRTGPIFHFRCEHCGFTVNIN